MDSDLEDDTEESGEPLAKREKSEHEVIQVIQVGALEDGSHPVVGVVQPGVLHSLPQPPQDHTEHILTPSAGTPTIRHCSATGNTYASVWGSEGAANLVWPVFAISLSTYLSLCESRCFRLFHALSLSALVWTTVSFSGSVWGSAEMMILWPRCAVRVWLLRFWMCRRPISLCSITMQQLEED